MELQRTLFESATKRTVLRHLLFFSGLREKDILCDICGKAFALRKSMLSHRLWHTGQHGQNLEKGSHKKAAVSTLSLTNVPVSDKDRYKCQFCDFSAPYKRPVALHTAEQHTQKVSETGRNPEMDGDSLLVRIFLCIAQCVWYHSCKTPSGTMRPQMFRLFEVGSLCFFLSLSAVRRTSWVLCRT